MSKTCCGTGEEPVSTQKCAKVSGSDCCGADQSHGNGHSHGHDDPRGTGIFRMFLPALLSLVLLLSALALDHLVPQSWFQGWPRIIWYILAYLPVGLPVIGDAIKSIRYSDFFSEFFLMSLATFGAFAIGEYPEAVAVMLFYSVGEGIQGLAVRRARGNIKSLLDQRPDLVTVLRGDKAVTIRAEEAKIGDIVQLKPGERLGLDGELLSGAGSFNTAALTGESMPDTKFQGQTVLAGMVNLNSPVQIRVTTAFSDSKLSKILNLVQEATGQKAPTERFIRKFAKVYTPIVVLLALCICLLPALFVEPYLFRDWLYKALVFLVISCPCALVISIPLGYFGGIGAGSRNGILFKGSNFLDRLAQVGTVAMDKTGTLTEGLLEVGEVVLRPGFDKEKILKMVNQLESHSSHPVATAIQAHLGELSEPMDFDGMEEIPGLGMKAEVEGQSLVVGNLRLMDHYGIPYDLGTKETGTTMVAIAYNGEYAGHITISDRLRTDSKKAVKQLQDMGIKVIMLSGDRKVVVEQLAEELGIAQAFGELLPEDKVNKLKESMTGPKPVAFVGDGVNDAAVIALSDVGIAMGGLGSDVAIETADVVIQDDRPSRIPTAIHIGKATKKIVWQNVLLAFGVKAAVLILGAGGLAGMWEAVFADVGVALLAILNAVRIQRMDFH